MTSATAAPVPAAPVPVDPLGPFWRRPGPDRSGLRNDAILAAVMLVSTALSAAIYDSVGFLDERPALWVTALWVVAISAPLALRRVYPEWVALWISAVFIAGAHVQVPELLFCNISLFVALYSVGAWSRNRTRATVVRVVIIFGMFVWLFSALVQGSSANTLAPDAFPDAPEGAILAPVVAFSLVQIITNLLYFGGAYYFGSRAWLSARDRAALELRTAELVTERERVADQAVTLERVRIARELHDVVAHHVSLMGVHAGAARRVFDRNPEQARESLGIVESNARDAVDELHRMLGALRSDDDGDPSAASNTSSDADFSSRDSSSRDSSGQSASAGARRSASTRGIAQLDELVEETRAAGHAVRIDHVGEPRPLPPTVGLVVYRVVQESLTNARKHAGAHAPVDVRVRYLRESVEVEVSDGGVGSGRVSAADAARTGGLGIIGMRERVAAVGGEITIGPKKRGGFVVRAEIPLPPQANTVAAPADTMAQPGATVAEESAPATPAAQAEAEA